MADEATAAPALGSLGGLPPVMPGMASATSPGMAGYESPVASLPTNLNVQQINRALGDVAYSNPGASPQTEIPSMPLYAQSANKWLALGQLSNVFQNYQDQQSKRQQQLFDSARTRLGDIWKLGEQNPNLRKDPRVVAQIAALHKALGIPVATDNNGNIDWDTLQPVRRLDEMNDAQQTKFMEDLQELPPDKRRAFARSRGVVGVGEDIFNDPTIKVPEKRLLQTEREFDTIFRQNGLANMSTDQLFTWVKLNRQALDQAYGASQVDELLNSRETLNTLGAKTQATLDALVAKGALTREQAELTKAKIGDARSLADLHAAEARIKTIDANNEDALTKARISELNARAKNQLAQADKASHYIDAVRLQQQGIYDREIVGNTIKELTVQQNYLKALNDEYQREYSAGMGIDPTLQSRINQQSGVVEQYKGLVDTFRSPAFIAQANKNAAVGIGGVKVNTDFGRPTGKLFTDRNTGATIVETDTGLFYGDGPLKGSPYIPPPGQK